MRPTIFAVTAPEIVETGRLSHEFMMEPLVPINELIRYASWWGFCKLRNADEKPDPWKLLRVGQRTFGTGGTSHWDLYCFSRGEFAFSMGAPAFPPGEEALQQLLHEAFRYRQGAVLLMQQDIFGPFRKACRAALISVKHHRHATALSTSYSAARFSFRE